jgi:hypothetical protein
MDLLRMEISAMATFPRVQAAISKCGPLQRGDRDRAREILALILEDFRDEIQESCATEWAALGAAEHAELDAFAELCAKQLILDFLAAAPA